MYHYEDIGRWTEEDKRIWQKELQALSDSMRITRERIDLIDNAPMEDFVFQHIPLNRFLPAEKIMIIKQWMIDLLRERLSETEKHYNAIK